MEVLRGMVKVEGGPYMANVGKRRTGEVPCAKAGTMSPFCMAETLMANATYGGNLTQLLEIAMQGQPQSTSIDGEFPDEPSSVATDATDAADDHQGDTLTVEDVMALCPNTKVWERDLPNPAMADHYIDAYFIFDPEEGYQPGRFDGYPVVGISWEQATRMLQLMSKQINEEREEKGLLPLPALRLPTAEECRYVAKNGRTFADYPWRGPYVRDERGEPYANVKINRNEYANGSGEPWPVDQDLPNDYGVCTYGNVYRWTNDNADEEGIWKQTFGSSYLSPPFCIEEAFGEERKDRGRAFIGLQPVMPYVGS